MKKLLATISHQEWRFVALLTLAVLILTGLPYLYGYLSASAGTIYNGLHALSPGDIPVYYSYIDQVKGGSLLVKDLFTSEPQPLGMLNVWWLLVGLVARLVNLSVPLAFQLARLAMIPVFTVVAYLFLAYFFSQPGQRKLALFFLLFSSGVGVYAAAGLDPVAFADAGAYHWPIDLWLTEANTFSTLYQTSHFIASITLMLLIFLLTLLAWEQRRIAYAFISGLLALFYFNFHPFYWPVIFGALGLNLLVMTWRAGRILWREAGYLALIFLLSLPAVLYHAWLLNQSAVISQRALQNITTISPWPFVLLGYGLLWPGFIVGLIFAVHQRLLSQRLGFLLVWFIVTVSLIYSSFPFHSRFTEGLHVILVIFTIVGLVGIWEYGRLKLKPKVFNFWFGNWALWLMLFLGFGCVSNIFSLARDLYYFTAKPGFIREVLYLTTDVESAMAWLRDQPADAVLAAEIPSKFIPSFSGQTVYAAHGIETLYFEAKQPLVFWFYADNTNDRAKRQFLLDRQIGYIFYSDYERQLGSFNPAGKDYLELVFDRPGAQVYRVR